MARNPTGVADFAADVSALESQFGPKKAPKSYLPSNILDPVKPIPVQGSIGGTGVDIGPLLSDNARRTQLAVSNANYKLATAQFAREGEMIEQATAERRKMAEIEEVKRQLEMEMEVKRAKLDERRVGVEEGNVKLREREVKTREADTPEARLAEDEARARRNNELKGEFNAQERAAKQAEREAERVKMAPIQQTVTAVMKELDTAGGGASFGAVVEAAMARIPGADIDLDMQDRIRKVAEQAMIRRGSIIRDAAKMQEMRDAKYDEILDDLILADSLDNAKPPEGGAGAPPFQHVLESVVSMLYSGDDDANPDTASGAASTIRHYAKRATLYHLNDWATKNKRELDAAKAEYEEANALDVSTLAGLKKASSLQRSDAMSEQIKSLETEIADRKAAFAENRRVRDAITMYLNSAIGERKKMFMAMAEEKTKQFGNEMFEGMYSNMAFDEATGEGE